MAQTSPSTRRALPPSVADKINGQSWQLWYDAVIDWILANPGGTMLECAKALNRGYAYVTLIVRSDAFQTALAVRRAKFEADLNAAIQNKLQGVGMAALELLQRKLETGGTTVPMKQAMEVAEMSLTKLGYGNPKLTPANGTPASTNVNLQVNVAVSRDTINNAREKQRKMHAERFAKPDEPLQIEATPNTPREVEGEPLTEREEGGVAAL